MKATSIVAFGGSVKVFSLVLNTGLKLVECLGKNTIRKHLLSWVGKDVEQGRNAGRLILNTIDGLNNIQHLGSI